jgi:hypothetical protein
MRDHHVFPGLAEQFRNGTDARNSIGWPSPGSHSTLVWIFR